MFSIKPGVIHHVIMNDETPVALIPYDFLIIAERIVRCLNTNDEAIRLLIEATKSTTDPELRSKMIACIKRMTE